MKKYAIQQGTTQLTYLESFLFSQNGVAAQFTDKRQFAARVTIREVAEQIKKCCMGNNLQVVVWGDEP